MKIIAHWLFKDCDYKDPDTREKIGIFSSIMGIILNVFLAVLKFILGTISGSIAILSDSFNNLSDSASSVVAYVGYKIANKPADKDHPFGHGRVEYLTSLVIGIIIVFVGLNLFVSSFDKVLNPSPLEYNMWILVALIASILIKVWMAMFNRYLGKECNSSVMISVFKDSFNDVVATSATVLAYILSPYTSLPLDGLMGIVVSCFVSYTGYEVIKDTFDSLLGKPIDTELVEKITKIIMDSDVALGVHDIMLHSYGPTQIMGSAHVEVSAKGDVLAIHDEIDEIERRIKNELRVSLTLHTDPIEEDDEVVCYCQNLIGNIIRNIHPQMSFHDLRVVSGPSHTNIVFDLVIPFDCNFDHNEIEAFINSELAKETTKYYTVITFDHEYH